MFTLSLTLMTMNVVYPDLLVKFVDVAPEIDVVAVNGVVTSTTIVVIPIATAKLLTAMDIQN